MIGRLLLAIFGMEQTYDRCPCCGAKKPRHAGLALHKDPIARWLDGEIEADEMDRELSRRIAGMPDVLEHDR